MYACMHAYMQVCVCINILQIYSFSSKLLQGKYRSIQKFMTILELSSLVLSFFL